MAASSESCIWMAAGVIAFRLCDRGFDCEHCPLDQALQGRTVPVDLRVPRPEGSPATIVFPRDRFYSRNHFWIGASENRARIGLDAFGVHLLGYVRAVRGQEEGEIESGEAFVELDLGLGNLTLHSPLRGLVHGINPRLRKQPELLLGDCYREGWLAELSADSPTELRESGFLDHREIERCAKHDLKRFRRRIAHHLLADDLGVGPTLADGGAPLNDLRLVLGFPRFLALLNELVG